MEKALESPINGSAGDSSASTSRSRLLHSNRPREDRQTLPTESNIVTSLYHLLLQLIKLEIIANCCEGSRLNEILPSEMVMSEFNVATSSHHLPLQSINLVLSSIYCRHATDRARLGSNLLVFEKISANCCRGSPSEIVRAETAMSEFDMTTSSYHLLLQSIKLEIFAGSYRGSPSDTVQAEMAMSVVLIASVAGGGGTLALFLTHLLFHCLGIKRRPALGKPVEESGYPSLGHDSVESDALGSMEPD